MSVSHERKIQAYPSEKYFRLFKSFFAGKTNTAGFVVMAKNFFDKMPEKEIARIQSGYICSVRSRNTSVRSTRKRTSRVLKRGRKEA